MEVNFCCRTCNAVVLKGKNESLTNGFFQINAEARTLQESQVRLVSDNFGIKTTIFCKSCNKYLGLYINEVNGPDVQFAFMVSRVKRLNEGPTPQKRLMRREAIDDLRNKFVASNQEMLSMLKGEFGRLASKVLMGDEQLKEIAEEITKNAKLLQSLSEANDF